MSRHVSHLAVLFSAQAASILSLTKYILGAPYTFDRLHITLCFTIPADYDHRTKNLQAFHAHPSFRLPRDAEGDSRKPWRWEFFAVTSSLGLAALMSHVTMCDDGMWQL
ncbi:hypothetical protein ASPVEDRAFT_621711 [Aspergillus versicolor CBS 583.65]|uniref:Uncharacterized protein n=1 Tax=Aspergillus versicolor CBS 583.65 TaxID=1036611 RepID=A0A1L9PI47_ASPVE|nr:uncharacterized protein ASPVEDRAFT_621711 [Aspergillus versicolor CBS 583.65]OJJ01204.1 hypothetical protein ASPVEDRAFT_621711 [Aspergillus versicolor CBS 583.65]